MRKITLLTLFSFLYTISFAQTVTGSWYGKASVRLGSDGSNNYLTELQIRQKGDEVEGVLGYYFRDQYQSMFVRGKYDSKTREMVIRNIPMMYFRSTASFTIDCFMNLSLVLNSSQVGKSLKGHFFSLEEYKNTCGDLFVSFTLDPTDYSHDSTFKAGFSTTKVWRPQVEDVVISSNPIKKDSIKVVTSMPVPTENSLKELFDKRRSIIADNIYVESDSIRVSLYDNGEVDGDSVSVFFNNTPVIMKQSLTAKALTVYVALDTTKEVNEISMFAENLGKYPPNTALMVVSDGVRNYEVFMSSSLSQNSVLRIRRKRR